METLAHQIRLVPTPSQEEYFRKACGTARFAWNWGLCEWQRRHQGGEKVDGLKLKKEFNARKTVEFPWTYEVTKYASQQPFLHLQAAFRRFFQKRPVIQGSRERG